MLHKRRIWTLFEVDTAGLLADKLTEHTWTLCTAFFVYGRPDVVFLNDSTTEDSVVEFAVLRKDGDSWYQIESITFGWCDHEKALRYVEQCLDPGTTLEQWAERAMCSRVSPLFEDSEQHRGRMCCA